MLKPSQRFLLLALPALLFPLAASAQQPRTQGGLTMVPVPAEAPVVRKEEPPTPTSPSADAHRNVPAPPLPGEKLAAEKSGATPAVPDEKPQEKQAPSEKPAAPSTAPVAEKPAAPATAPLAEKLAAPAPASSAEKPAPAVQPAADRSIQLPAPSNAEKPAVAADKPLAPTAQDCSPGASRSLAAEANGLKRRTLVEIRGAVQNGRTAYLVSDNDRVVVLDMPNIRDQGHMFGRLIFFVERGGTPKTRVMTVPEVQAHLAKTKESVDTLTVGNNLRAAELARFFNTARVQGEPLTSSERELYDSLLQWGLLREEPAGVAVMEPEMILITIPQASSVAGCNGCGVTPEQRATIFEHEMAHAKFATDTVYQNYSVWFWANTMSPEVRDKFTRFLRSRGYDTNNRDLLANEMQAFLMHTPDAAMFSAKDLGITDAELKGLREAFTAGVAVKPMAVAEKTYQLD
jgi:hypothetical protein